MTSRFANLGRWILLGCMASLLVTCSCASDTVPANIHSVNYSGEDFLFWLEDPLDSKNRGDGETVGPYAASGIMCCYALPRQWRSGLQVKIHVTHYFKKTPDAELSEATETQIVEVPPYVDGKVGEIWVLRGADGAMSIVSSDYQPNHAKWPGKVKGWPIPSIEYRRQRVDLSIRQAEGYVRAFTTLIKDLRESPDSAAESAWKSQQYSFKDSLHEFSGPRDEKFRKTLSDSYQKDLAESTAELARLKAKRP